MGGAGSDEMKRFRSHCYSAFLILRKHATLILNLFALMVDSNVQDIALDPDRTTAKVTPPPLRPLPAALNPTPPFAIAVF